jgi:serine/threonine protein kinase
MLDHEPRIRARCYHAPRLQGSSVIAIEPEPEPPRRLGKYQLVRRLARGGMGDVHLAKLPGELGFEKLLVVKTIRSELAADPRFVELFASEAKTAVALSHPNITPIYELGRAEDGSLYTAMGWVDGPSLAQWIARLRSDRRRFELGAALLITRELLDGLAHAHSRDHGRAPVVHRDITPRNVLVDRSGRVQIVDFSVGCVLFELLTLEQAFPREGVWMRPDLSALPVELRGLLERALAIDPTDRFADAHEFFRRLAPVQAELAPSYATSDLAAALREQFATGGWTETDAGAPEVTSSNHVTPVNRTIAFATRVVLDDPADASLETDEPSQEVALAIVAPAREPKVYDHDEPEGRPSAARRPRSGLE